MLLSKLLLGVVRHFGFFDYKGGPEWEIRPIFLDVMKSRAGCVLANKSEVNTYSS